MNAGGSNATIDYFNTNWGVTTARRMISPAATIYPAASTPCCRSAIARHPRARRNGQRLEAGDGEVVTRPRW